MTLDEYLFPGETRLNYQTIVVLRILSITPDEIVLIDGTLAAIENKIPIPGHDLDRVGFRVGDQVSIVVGRLIRRWPDETLHPAAPRLGDEFAENLRQVLGAELARTISTHYVLVWHRMEARIRIPYHRERAARVVSRLGRRLPW